jgi:nucleoside-diphosphate-sugar epimerase
MSVDLHAVSRKPRTDDGHLKWWQGDLSDFATTKRLIEEVRPDIIFHLTTHGWGAPDIEHVRPTVQNDLLATVNLLTVATYLKISRVVLTSSLEEPPEGDREPVPSSPYAAAKWASAGYARMFHRLYQTPIVIVRIFMTYGPGQPVQKLIPHTILSLLKGENPKLSDGQRLVDWIYVEDVIRGLLAAARAHNVEGTTVDLGSGLLVSIREVVEHLVSLLRTKNRPSFGALPSRPAEPIRAANRIDAYEKIGWQAAIPLKEGLALTVNWYKAQAKGKAAELPTITLEENQSQKYSSPETATRS